MRIWAHELMGSTGTRLDLANAPKSVRRLAAVGALVAGLAAPGVASATTIGFTLDINDDYNIPTITLTNDSALDITDFSFSIGDTAFNFDLGDSSVPTGGITGAANGQSGRIDMLAVSFSDFNSGESYSVDLDVDPDSSNHLEDYRTVFFNNGSAPNAEASVKFADGRTLSLVLSDGPALSTLSASTSAVPEPATLALFGLGLAGLGYSRRRRIA